MQRVNRQYQKLRTYLRSTTLKDRLILTFSIPVILVVLGHTIYGRYGDFMMEGLEGGSTIGTTTDIWRNARGGRRISYEFCVNDTKYHASTTYRDDIKVPHGYYWVRFWKKDPSISDLLTEQPTDATLLPCPKQ